MNTQSKNLQKALRRALPHLEPLGSLTIEQLLVIRNAAPMIAVRDFAVRVTHREHGSRELCLVFEAYHRNFFDQGALQLYLDKLHEAGIVSPEVHAVWFGVNRDGLYEIWCLMDGG